METSELKQSYYVNRMCSYMLSLQILNQKKAETTSHVLRVETCKTSPDVVLLVETVRRTTHVPLSFSFSKVVASCTYSLLGYKTFTSLLFNQHIDTYLCLYKTKNVLKSIHGWLLRGELSRNPST
jgi:hypothetical protein